MTIVSRFAGKCKRCGGDIVAGQQVEWKRGQGATHLTAAECAAAPKTVAPAVTLNADPIVAFLTAAQQRGLKWPKARFLAPTGGELRLSLSGARSKAPGSVDVKVDNVWIGRVRPDGSVSGTLRSDAAMREYLTRIANEPAKAAAQYGALMHHCSFCALPLTDAGSVEAGYGPICAERFGLPHTALGTPAVQVVQ